MAVTTAVAVAAERRSEAWSASVWIFPILVEILLSGLVTFLLLHIRA